MVRDWQADQFGTLREYLDGYTVPVLKGLAGLLSSAPPTRKTELVGFIHQHLSTDAGLRAVWKSLDELQQAAVAEALHSPSGRYDAVMFRAKYGQEPYWGEPDEYGTRVKLAPIALLVYNATIPTDLRAPLVAFVPVPRPAEIETSAEAPRTVRQREFGDAPGRKRYRDVAVAQRDMERAAQNDFKAVLRLTDAGRLQASGKTKQATAASARAITEVLEGGDFYLPPEKPDPWVTDPGPIKAFAWCPLLQNAGLVELAGTRLQLTGAGKKALSAPSHEVIRNVWNRWLKSGPLDEFNRVHTIKGQAGRAKRSLTAPASRRKVIVQTLQSCPPGRWIAFDEFSRFMRARGAFFRVSDNLWHLYVGGPYYGHLGYEGFGAWHIVQDRYLLAFLFEYAATLGLIDVAYVPPGGARPDYFNLWGADDLDALSRYDGLLAFRINNLGAWCLGLADTYSREPFAVRQVLKVLPNHEIAITQPLPAGDVLLLRRVAEQRSDFVWKIERSILLAALEEGQPISEIVDFLEARSGEPLPPNVAVFFKETSERALKVTDRGAARLIEVEDTALAHLIARHSRLRSLCMLAGERYLVVPEASERAFRRALRKLGYALKA